MMRILRKRAFSRFSLLKKIMMIDNFLNWISFFLFSPRISFSFFASKESIDSGGGWIFLRLGRLSNFYPSIFDFLALPSPRSLDPSLALGCSDGRVKRP